MKLTTEEHNIIRRALMSVREHAIALGDIYTLRDLSVARSLLDREFIHIPESAPVVRAPVEQKPTPKAPDISGESNTKITVHVEGYFVWARRRSPFNFYIVEYCALHSHAKLLCEQLDADDVMRGKEIREGRNYDFYANRAVPRKERTPRERMEPVTFSFE